MCARSSVIIMYLCTNVPTFRNLGHGWTALCTHLPWHRLRAPRSKQIHPQVRMPWPAEIYRYVYVTAVPDSFKMHISQKFFKVHLIVRLISLRGTWIYFWHLIQSALDIDLINSTIFHPALPRLETTVELSTITHTLYTDTWSTEVRRQKYKSEDLAMAGQSKEAPIPPWGLAIAGATGAVLANALVYPLDMWDNNEFFFLSV
jgi:hypothetical protein